jgi:hypothetical protein
MEIKTDSDMGNNIQDLERSLSEQKAGGGNEEFYEEYMKTVEARLDMLKKNQTDAMTATLDMLKKNQTDAMTKMAAKSENDYADMKTLINMRPKAKTKNDQQTLSIKNGVDCKDQGDTESENKMKQNDGSQNIPNIKEVTTGSEKISEKPEVKVEKEEKTMKGQKRKKIINPSQNKKAKSESTSTASKSNQKPQVNSAEHEVEIYQDIDAMSREELEDTLKKWHDWIVAGQVELAKDDAKIILNRLGPFRPSQGEPASTKHCKTDKTALKVMNERTNGYKDTHRTLWVKPNGSCLPNSASMYFEGDESRSLELRVRTAAVMLLEEDNLVKEAKSRRWYGTCKLTYTEELEAITSPTGWCNAMCLEAMGRATQSLVASVYPNVGEVGMIDFKGMNRTFNESSTHLKWTITVMWTNIAGMDKSREVNHFVPIVEINPQPAIVHVDDSPQAMINVNKIDRVSKGVAKELNFSDSEKEDGYTCDLEDSSEEFNLSSSDKDEEDIKKMDMYESAKVKSVKSADEEDENEYSDEHEEEVVLKRLKNMKAYKIIEYAKNNSPIDELPMGPKGNKRYVVDNKENFERLSSPHEEKENCEYWDDEGAYCNCSSTYHLYQKRKNDLCYLRGVLMNSDGILVKKGVALKNQPNMSTIFRLRVTYQTHVADKKFRKKTTMFVKVPEEYKTLLERAVIEYQGTDPPETEHGNSKNVNIFYFLRMGVG